MTRHNRIRTQLAELERRGIITDGYTRGNMPGTRWIFTPTGFSERSLSTSGIEDFILGAQAALNASAVTDTDRYAPVSRVGYGPVPPVK